MSRSGRARSSPGGSGKGDDFYSQIANLAGDLDSSGTDGSGGELNSTSPLQVDIDSLEDSLFSSLRKETSSRNRRDIGMASSLPAKKEATVDKKSKGFDMGELSKLLGTDDIMKDLTSAKSKPSGTSSVAKGTPHEAADPQIKKDADELLDLLSATDFDASDSKPAKSKVMLSTIPSKLDEIIIPNAGKPITSAADDVAGIPKNTDAKQKIEGPVSSVDPPKATSREKRPLKTAATVSFDSDDDDDDLLAGLGLDDDSSGKKGENVGGAMGKREGGHSNQILTSAAGDGKVLQTEPKAGATKKSVRFSEDVKDLASSPNSLLDDNDSLTTQKQSELEGVGNKERMDLPSFPWQKKAQPPMPSSSGLIPAANSHEKVNQTKSEKLEPPQFPWQKKTQMELLKKSPPDGSTLPLDDPLGSRQETVAPHPQTENQKLSSPEDLLGLGDPFAKTTQKTHSKPELQNHAPALPEAPLELDDPFTKRNRRQTQSQAELSQQPSPREGNLGDPFTKASRKLAQSQAEPSQEGPASPLDLGDPFAKTSRKPMQSQARVQSQSPEALVQFDDPFAKPNRRTARLQTTNQTLPTKSSSVKLPNEVTNSSAAIKLESPRPPSVGQPATGGGHAEKKRTMMAVDGTGVRQEDLLRALKRAEEAEAALEKERSEHAQCKMSLMDAENKLHLTKSEMEKWRLEAQAYKSNMSETEASRQSMQEELRTKLNENILALQKVEMDYSHAQELLGSTKKRHEEEMESLRQSHDLRVKNLEESLNRMENRWKDELKIEVGRWQEKLEHAEKEKFEAMQSLQRKLDTLEVAKVNDMDRIKSLYMSSMETMQKDHETEKEQLVRRHKDEVAAIKIAHSHSKNLTELNNKVEASSQMISQLQAKLAEEHGKVLEERAHRNRAQESQLKVMEERLVQQQVENEAERTRLQGLLAKMEAHVSQQNRTLEQDRWTLQQDQARLKAQQIAFREEQIRGRKKLEEDREQFQQTREQFLVEQQDILAKCYQEQRKIAMEKAETSLRRKKAEDYEISSRQISQQTIEDRNLSISHLNEELVKVEIEKKKLSKLEEDLKVERRLVDAEKERLQKFADDVCSRSREVDTMCKDAVEMQKAGERELKEAQEMKKEYISQQEHLQAELAHLRKKELQISTEQLELLEQRKHLQQLIQRTPATIDGRVRQFEPATSAGQGISSFTPIPVARNVPPEVPLLDNESLPYPALQASQPHSLLYSSLAIPPASPPPQPATITSLPLMQSSPVHCVPKLPAIGSSTKLRSSRPSPPKPTSIQAYLKQLEDNINLRQLDADAQKDYEELEKQQAFLASLSNSRMNL